MVGEEGEAGTYWVNGSFTGVTAGVTSGISFAAQSHYTLRVIGSVNDGSRYNTTVVMTGVTAGGTGGSNLGDGSFNRYGLMNYPQSHAFGVSLNSDSIPANGWSSGVPTELGQPYKHGATELYGHWNRIYAQHFVRGLDLTCIGTKVNALILEPSYGYFYNGGNGGFGNTTSTQFDVNRLYFDKDSTARYFGIKNIEQMHGDITVHGDVQASSGFACVSPDGASGGNSGGIQLANGSFTFTPPSKASTEATTPTVRVGFPLSAGTKQSTTITHAYFNTGVQPSVLTLDGNFTSTNFYMNEGTMQFSDNLPQNATVDISNLQLNGSSVLDMSLPSLYTGNNAIKVITQSDAVIIKPGKGTAMTVSQTLVPLSS
jgi:hypothetical protein